MTRLTLNAANSPYPLNLPSRYAEATVATAGTWAGDLTFSYQINGEEVIYKDGAFTENTDFVFHPATDTTYIAFAGTGDVEIEVNVSKFAK